MALIFEGTPITLAGIEYIIPPLNFKSLRTLKPRLEAMAGSGGGALSDDQMGAMVDAIHAAITRNYPEITKDFMEDVLDLGNIFDITSAIMSNSGFTRGKEPAPAPLMSL